MADQDKMMTAASEADLMKEFEQNLASKNGAELMKELEQSMKDMQKNLEDTYKTMEDMVLSGESHDKTVTIKMSATYKFEDIEFDKAALQGGVSEFKWRIREAWKNLSEKIQDATQQKTMDLLGNMNVPENFQQEQEEE